MKEIKFKRENVKCHAQAILIKRPQVKLKISFLKGILWSFSCFVLFHHIHRLSPLFLEKGFSDWSPWSDCQGVRCQMGQQQRMRACLKSPKTDGIKSICHGEQVQERACMMPCTNQNSSISSPSVRSFSKGNISIVES